MAFGASARCCGLAAMTLVLGLVMAFPAMADRQDRGRRTYQRDHVQSPHWQNGHSYGGYGRYNNSGAFLGGALLGLGAGTVLGGALVAPPPTVYRPPVYNYYNYGGSGPYYVYPTVPR
jgi:hypothetical protein